MHESTGILLFMNNIQKGWEELLVYDFFQLDKLKVQLRFVDINGTCYGRQMAFAMYFNCSPLKFLISEHSTALINTRKFSSVKIKH